MIKIKAIVLAAGYATRLWPLTKNKPKQLLKIGDKPIIEYIIKKIEEVPQIDKIFIVTNNKFITNFEEWLKNFECLKQIELVNDGSNSNEDRLGAIGDIVFVIKEKHINEDMIVIAGDNLFEMSLKDFVVTYNNYKRPLIALYNVQDRELAKQYGVVTIDNSNKIIHFIEKPSQPNSTLISTGIYIFPKNILTLIKKYIELGYSKDKTGEFIEWLYKQVNVFGYVVKERWYDIGSFNQLEAARQHIK